MPNQNGSIYIGTRSPKDIYVGNWLRTLQDLGQSRSLWISAILIAYVRGDKIPTGTPLESPTTPVQTPSAPSPGPNLSNSPGPKPTQESPTPANPSRSDLKNTPRNQTPISTLSPSTPPAAPTDKVSPRNPFPSSPALGKTALPSPALSDDTTDFDFGFGAFDLDDPQNDNTKQAALQPPSGAMTCLTARPDPLSSAGPDVIPKAGAKTLKNVDIST